MSDPLYVGPLLHLRTLPAFTQLGPRQLRDLAYECEEVVLERDAELVRPGEAADAMYLIVDGFVTAGAGRDVIGPGGVAGFYEVLASSAARYGAVAETEVVALRVEADALRDVCEQNFPILFALLGHVAGRVADDGATLGRAVAGGSAAGSASSELGRVDRILALSRAPYLTGPHVDALAELAARSPAIVAAEGENLWDLSDPPSRVLVVCSGAIRLSSGVAEEIEVGPGATLGLAETLSGRMHADRATATSRSVLLEIDAESFIDVLEDHFEMAADLLGRLTRLLLPSSGPA